MASFVLAIQLLYSNCNPRIKGFSFGTSASQLMKLNRPKHFHVSACLWKIWRQPTLAEAIQPLPSARLCLTAVFGMGTGRTTALWPPKLLVLEGVFGFGQRFSGHKVILKCKKNGWGLFPENYTQDRFWVLKLFWWAFIYMFAILSY